jgi:hypothetical protein
MRGIAVLKAMRAAPYMAAHTATRMIIRLFFHMVKAALINAPALNLARNLLNQSRKVNYQSSKRLF